MTHLDEREREWGDDPFEAVGPARLDPFVQLGFVHAALDDYQAAELEQLDDDWFEHLVGSAESLRSRVDAVLAGIAAEADRRDHGRTSGCFSAKAFIKHHGVISGPEAHARMQVQRLVDTLPTWKAAASLGEVGSDQLRLMSRVGANPRIHDEMVERADELLLDAQVLSYDDFERRLRDFARSADSEGARTEAEKIREARRSTMRLQPNGSWKLTAVFGSLQGAEVNEILAHFNDAEFRTDWEEARKRLSNDVSVSDLSRGEAQRRADALQRALQAAAAAPGDSMAPLTTLNVLIDEETLRRALTDEPLEAGRYRNMVCRTQNGDMVDVTEAASLALFEHVRRAVHDGAGVVTELGRRSRVFRGGNREAALLLSGRCVWPGCDVRVRGCQVDHAVEWMHLGATDPDNAACLCGRHNRLKHTGHFRARRRPNGEWIFIDPEFNRVR